MHVKKKGGQSEAVFTESEPWNPCLIHHEISFSTLDLRHHHDNDNIRLRCYGASCFQFLIRLSFMCILLFNVLISRWKVPVAHFLLHSLGYLGEQLKYFPVEIETSKADISLAWVGPKWLQPLSDFSKIKKITHQGINRGIISPLSVLIYDYF